MNRIFYGFTLVMVLFSGVDNSIQSDFQYQKNNIEKIQLDLFHSKIFWKGTKMNKKGKHEGEIFFKEGFIIEENNKLKRGEFVVDLNRILVTDIPEHEPVPRKNLTNHLKSDDFFSVEKFNEAHFKILEVAYLDHIRMKVEGDLIIKSISRKIDFIAEYDKANHSYQTQFSFNRFDWNIPYIGKIENNMLVDKDIELKVQLRLKK